METAGRRASPQRPDRGGVGVRGDRLPHQRGSHQTGAGKRTDENGPHVVSRKAGEHRASHAPHALCPAAQSGTKTGSDQTGRVIQFSSPQVDTLSACFRETCERAGIESLGPHILRHTFASRLVMAGVDLRTVQELMGHKDINMTLRYAHLSPDHKRAAIETLESRFSAKIP